ncbi:hypothetical protein D3C85_885180 [compost metagenome]
MGGHGHAQIGGLQHGGVPGGDVFEAVIDAMVAHVADHFLGAGDGDRRLAGDCVGNAHDAVEQAGVVAVDAIDQAHAPRFVGAKRATSVSQFAQHAVTDDPRQALQRANVGGHADVDFLDRKLCVLGGITHVARGNQVDGATQAVTLNGRKHRFAAVIDRIERRLQGEDLAPQQARIASDVLAQLIGHAGQHHQVDPRGEMLACPAEDHHAHFIGVVDPLEDLDDLAPERGVHRVDLLRTVDLHMGDFIDQFDVERSVLRHANDPFAGKNEARTITRHQGGQ